MYRCYTYSSNDLQPTIVFRVTDSDSPFGTLENKPVTNLQPVMSRVLAIMQKSLNLETYHHIQWSPRR